MRCDLDHLHDYALGGDTTIWNLCCLCRRHHRAKHAGRYRVRRGRFGIEWTTPRGQRYLVTHRPLTDPLVHHLDQAPAGYHHPTHLRR